MFWYLDGIHVLREDWKHSLCYGLLSMFSTISRVLARMPLVKEGWCLPQDILRVDGDITIASKTTKCFLAHFMYRKPFFLLGFPLTQEKVCYLGLLCTPYGKVALLRKPPKHF